MNSNIKYIRCLCSLQGNLCVRFPYTLTILHIFKRASYFILWKMLELAYLLTVFIIRYELMPYRTTNLKQSSMFKSRKYVKKIQIVITSVNLETRIEVHRLHKSPFYAYNTRHVKFTLSNKWLYDKNVNITNKTAFIVSYD